MTSVFTGPVTLEDVDITSPAQYVAYGHPWAYFDLLRHEAPVYWYERPGFEPFWAITKYEDVAAISQNPDVFSNGQRIRLEEIDFLDFWNNGLEQRAKETGCPFDKPIHMLHMDPPSHRANRAIVNRTFTPRYLSQFDDEFATLAEKYADDLLATLTNAGGQPVNFVRAFADKLPLFAICTLAGIPQDHWQTILRWTGARADPSDPEYRVEGLSPQETKRASESQFEEYVLGLAAARRGDTEGSDLVSCLANAEVDGKRFSDRELMDYLTFLISAGNETTRSATAYGVEALLRHPDQLQRLIEDPSLVDTAVEEILRWSCVVIHFSRTVAQDTEIRGQRIRAGETIVMFYPSAHRDEDVFDDPYTFDIGRDPNPHLAFGRGEHYCLGVNLARQELRTLIRALLPVLPRLELAGPIQRINRLDTLLVRGLPVALKGS